MIFKIKKYLSILPYVCIIIFGIYIYGLYTDNKSLKSQLSISKSNEKAFLMESSKLNKEIRVFKYNIEQLNYYNDSILIEMNNVRKELKIKDNELLRLSYLLTESSKKDTVIFRDTIFNDPKLSIDTVLGDKWYQLKLGLKYPNIITTEPSFISEKYIIVNTKKETIDPPKKFFLLRWFQKKHRVVEVNIVEKSPYSKTKEQKFIEIIK